MKHCLSHLLRGMWCDLFSVSWTKMCCHLYCVNLCDSALEIGADNSGRSTQTCMMTQSKLWLMNLFKPLNKPFVIKLVSQCLNFQIHSCTFHEQFFMESLQMNWVSAQVLWKVGTNKQLNNIHKTQWPVFNECYDRHREGHITRQELWVVTSNWSISWIRKPNTECTVFTKYAQILKQTLLT